MHRLTVAMGLATALVTTAVPALAAGEKVSVVTPYLAAVATAEMIDAFRAKATEYGWTVEAVDTAGDLAAFASRVEDAATAADAIVLVSVDRPRSRTVWTARAPPASRSLPSTAAGTPPPCSTSPPTTTCSARR